MIGNASRQDVKPPRFLRFRVQGLELKVTLSVLGVYRLRIGPYRIIYTRLDDQLIIEVIKIRPRGDIYKR